MRPATGPFLGKTTYALSLLENVSGVAVGEWMPINGVHPVSIEIIGASTGATVQLWVSNTPDKPLHGGVQIRDNFLEDVCVYLDVPVRWIRATVPQAGTDPVSVYVFGSY